MADCQVCGQEPEAFTVIPSGQGDPQFLGVACLARFGLEMAKEVLPPEEIAATLGPMFVAPARAEALGKASKRAKREEPAPEPEREAEAGPAEGADGESAAAANE
jgi:hypothetical protein